MTYCCIKPGAAAKAGTRRPAAVPDTEILQLFGAAGGPNRPKIAAVYGIIGIHSKNGPAAAGRAQKGRGAACPPNTV